MASYSEEGFSFSFWYLLRTIQLRSVHGESLLINAVTFNFENNIFVSSCPRARPFASNHLETLVWFWLCIGQIEASTCPSGKPREFDFFENFGSNSPLPGPKCRSNAPHQGPFRWSNAPTPGTFHREQKWQKDGGNAFSCRKKSL